MKSILIPLDIQTNFYYNHQMSYLPIVLAAVESGAQLGAMEVSSHALAQQRVAGCRFSGAVFTNLTQDHLDYHDSMEEYFEAKACLFQSPLFPSSMAKAIVNIDDVWGTNR